jgi:hypothetical protein
MSLSRETMLALMAYADGELEGKERDRVDALLTKSEEARRVVGAMRGGAVGVWLAGTAAGAAAGARGAHPAAHPADGIADAVMARVAHERTVVSLGAAREKRAARVRTAGGIAVIAALAAGIALYVGATASKDPSGGNIARDNVPGHPQPPPSSVAVPPQVVSTAQPLPGPIQVASVLPSAVPLPEQPVVALAPEGVEVHEVDGDRDVSVIYLPAPVGAAANVASPSVVIWLGAENSGR